MRLELARRAEPPAIVRALGSIAALLVATAIAALALLLAGGSPLAAIGAAVLAPLADPSALAATLAVATPLVLVATGLCYCLRAGLWNLGAEGQLVMGAVAATALALALRGSDPGPWPASAAMLAGALAGAAWAAIPAFLRNRFGASEALASILLVFVAELLLDWLARGPWRGAPSFEGVARAPLVPGLEVVDVGLLLALLAVVVSAAALRRSLFGYRLGLTGEAPRAARFAGFDPARTTLLAFLISGALAGLAGALVAGEIGRVVPDVSPDYGFVAIAVAVLGRLAPVGVLAAGVATAVLLAAGEAARAPRELVLAFAGVLLLCVLTADALLRYRVRLVRGTARA